MDYYSQILNRVNPCPRPLLTATQADARIAELEEEVKTAHLMVTVLKAVIQEQKAVIAAAVARRVRNE